MVLYLKMLSFGQEESGAPEESGTCLIFAASTAPSGESQIAINHLMKSDCYDYFSQYGIHETVVASLTFFKFSIHWSN